MSDAPPLPGPLPSVVPSPSQARRLALAFQKVFGSDARAGRSSDQRLVMAHMRKVCCMDAPVFQQGTNGAYDPVAAAQRDGARTWGLIVDRQLTLAKKNQEEDEKPKPKSIR